MSGRKRRFVLKRGDGGGGRGLKESWIKTGVIRLGIATET